MNGFGLMEPVNREFDDGKQNRGLCLKCHKYFLVNIMSRLEEADRLEEVQTIEDEVLSELQEKYGESSQAYVKDFFLNYKAAFNLTVHRTTKEQTAYLPRTLGLRMG